MYIYMYVYIYIYIIYVYICIYICKTYSKSPNCLIVSQQQYWDY